MNLNSRLSDMFLYWSCKFVRLISIPRLLNLIVFLWQPIFVKLTFHCKYLPNFGMAPKSQNCVANRCKNIVVVLKVVVKMSSVHGSKNWRFFNGSKYFATYNHDLDHPNVFFNSRFRQTLANFLEFDKLTFYLYWKFFVAAISRYIRRFKTLLECLHFNHNGFL